MLGFSGQFNPKMTGVVGVRAGGVELHGPGASGWPTTVI